MNDIHELETELQIKKREARREYKCHFGAANYYKSLHTRLGSVSVILSITAGSAFVGSLIESLPVFRFAPSLLVLVAACLTGLITFNKYLELSALHYQSGLKWERMRDRYEAIYVKITTAQDNDAPGLLEEYEACSRLRAQTREETIPIPGWLFRRHERIVDKTEK